MAEDDRTASITASAVSSQHHTRESSAEGGAEIGEGGSGDGRSQEASRRRPQPLQTLGNYGSITGVPRVTSPDLPGPRPTRNTAGLARRISSRQLPHRGQEFSADDASQEVEDEAQMRLARQSSGSVLRRPSTVRRRPAAQAPRLTQIHSTDDEDTEELHRSQPTPAVDVDAPPGSSGEEGTLQAGEDEADQDADDLSDAESFTLKDRQQAINETHPFGIRIWKAALYKKSRSVEKDAEGDIHSTPGGYVSRWSRLFNFLWTLLFGWWLALVAATGSFLCYICVFAPGCRDYGRVLLGFATYIFYPFGKYVKLIQDEAYAEEDEGEGRSISEYEQWQSGDLEDGRLFFGPVRSLIGRRRSDEESDDEETSLLGRTARGQSSSEDVTARPKRRLFGRGQWNLGRVIFFVFFYGLLTPLLFLVSLICWMGVFTIPMGRVTLILFDHLRRHPLALEFHHDTTYTRAPGSSPSSILLCTYGAVGLKYWKYTIGGTNIFLINLLGVVFFTIVDYWVLDEALGLDIPLTNNFFVFLLALFSIIPLAYFIGQAVASISAQSTMGVGAAVNAFFSTIVEVFLYCVALNQGKAQLVEGSVIGSIFAGILFLPGLSMCFGAIKRKTQRFNVKSAGVTSTMLLFAVIGVFGPTLFYQIYGAHELNCHQCKDESGNPLDRDCRRCFFTQVPAVHDPFYTTSVLPYVWFAALLLFLSYVIGLLFTLRTHAATIWQSEIEEKNKRESGKMRPQKPPSIQDFGAALTRSQTSGSVHRDIRDSNLYKRILGQSLRQAGIPGNGESSSSKLATPASPPGPATTLSPDAERQNTGSKRIIRGLSEVDNQSLVRQMAEMAATAATVATREASQSAQTPRKLSQVAKTSAQAEPGKSSAAREVFIREPEEAHAESAAGGHDAPNWSRGTSYVVLLTATVAYAVIAEILVNTVDAVLENVDIDEKFLGITLFALVPNTTEFLNAISFAMNGNIALSMEIGSAYALQVCLLQIPALVAFSGWYGQYIDSEKIIDHAFTLIFPQWDMVTVILCVFLLSYMYGEGKSNYFKGSILILSYLVVVVGFYLSPPSSIGVGDSSDSHTTITTTGRRMVTG